MIAPLICTLIMNGLVTNDWRSKHTPMMAWNAWNTFSQDGKPIRGGLPEYKGIAEAMVASGMRDAGYNLISTVCTDWVGRDSKTGILQQNLTIQGLLIVALKIFSTEICFIPKYLVHYVLMIVFQWHSLPN